MLTAAMVADESGEDVANRRETRKYGSVAFDLRMYLTKDRGDTVGLGGRQSMFRTHQHSYTKKQRVRSLDSDHHTDTDDSG